jgi:hypothetical protein
MNLMIPFLMLMLTQGTKSPASTASKPRKSFKGKSGRTWFVVDSTAGASNTPVRDVFAAATGNELVLSFAVLSGIRASLFVAPSKLSQQAIDDFDVTAKAGKL